MTGPNPPSPDPVPDILGEAALDPDLVKIVEVIARLGDRPAPDASAALAQLMADGGKPPRARRAKGRITFIGGALAVSMGVGMSGVAAGTAHLQDRPSGTLTSDARSATPDHIASPTPRARDVEAPPPGPGASPSSATSVPPSSDIPAPSPAPSAPSAVAPRPGIVAPAPSETFSASSPALQSGTHAAPAGGGWGGGSMSPPLLPVVHRLEAHQPRSGSGTVAPEPRLRLARPAALFRSAVAPDEVSDAEDAAAAAQDLEEAHAGPDDEPSPGDVGLAAPNPESGCESGGIVFHSASMTGHGEWKVLFGVEFTDLPQGLITGVDVPDVEPGEELPPPEFLPEQPVVEEPEPEPTAEAPAPGADESTAEVPEPGSWADADHAAVDDHVTGDAR